MKFEKYSEQLIFDSTGENGIIKKFIHQKGIVFDVGANVGAWSKTVLEKYDQIQIHLFEPVLYNYKILENNLANWLEKENIYVNQIAVSNYERLQTFYFYQEKPAWSTFYRLFDVEKQYGLKAPVELPVLTTTLDKYCYELQINRINFLKIDVEGGELDVLYGAKELLGKGKIDYIQFEYGGTFQDSGITLKQVFNYLHKFKYSLLKIEPHNLIYIPEFLQKYENFQYSNYLAVNERFKSNILGEKPEMLPLAELCANSFVKPRGVIHIGAHEGQELNDYLAMGVEKILYIEANPNVFARLQSKIANHTNVQAVCCAIGKENGTVTLHITSMDQSSSILPLKVSSEIYPMIKETEQIRVMCKTLDTLLKELNLNPSDFNILNIDIQGAELLALQGSVNTLQYIEAINTEINYEELYTGCALIDEIDDFLETYDFKRIAITTPYHPSWGDAFYAKKPVISMTTLGKNGRFGNQIFQYLFLKTYAQTHNLRVETPSWIGQNIFGHNDPPISKLLPIVRETTNNIKTAIIPNTEKVLQNVDFWGYFQYNSKYYAPHKDYFHYLFTPIPHIKAKVEQAVENIRKKGKTIIGLHLRRGDYGYEHFFVAPSQWYLEWLKNVWSTLDEPVLFIASDEIERVKQDFIKYNPVTAKDLDCELTEAPFYVDFYLLSKCDILAISNSSF